MTPKPANQVSSVASDHSHLPTKEVRLSLHFLSVPSVHHFKGTVAEKRQARAIASEKVLQEGLLELRRLLNEKGLVINTDSKNPPYATLFPMEGSLRIFCDDAMAKLILEISAKELIKNIILDMICDLNKGQKLIDPSIAR